MSLKRLSSFCGLAFAFFGASNSFAVTNLKHVQISGGDRVDLLFDGKIGRNQIRTEFINQTIQISFTDSAVYPAKISTVSGGELTKVFAYQYSPRLVRCRLTIKGKAEDYRDRLQFEQNGKVLTVKIEGAEIASAKTPEADRTEEKALLARILKAQAPPVTTGTGSSGQAAAKSESASAAARANADQVSTVQASTASTETVSSASDLVGRHDSQAGAREGLATGKVLISPMKTLSRLGFVLALFCVAAFLVKKFVLSGGGALQSASSGARSVGGSGALNRFLQRGFGRYGKSGRMIEVVSTHYLGPKKSIAVVKVAGRMLVLGIANEAINLITQLDGDESELDLESLGVKDAQPRAAATQPSLTASSSAAGAQRGDVARPAPSRSESSEPDDFITFLTEETRKPMPPLGQTGSVRAQIRNRLEGMKPL